MIERQNYREFGRRLFVDKAGITDKPQLNIFIPYLDTVFTVMINLEEDIHLENSIRSLQLEISIDISDSLCQ